MPDPMTVLDGEWPGLMRPGSLDLLNRPSVQNPAGGESSVYSMSIGVDGLEYLIPRVSEDGRLLSEDEAIKAFDKTGNHLGAFDLPRNATAYAQKLHEQQASLGRGKQVDNEFRHSQRGRFDAWSPESLAFLRQQVPQDDWGAMRGGIAGVRSGAPGAVAPRAGDIKGYDYKTPEDQRLLTWLLESLMAANMGPGGERGFPVEPKPESQKSSRAGALSGSQDIIGGG